MANRKECLKEARKLDHFLDDQKIIIFKLGESDALNNARYQLNVEIGRLGSLAHAAAHADLEGDLSGPEGDRIFRLLSGINERIDGVKDIVSPERNPAPDLPTCGLLLNRLLECNNDIAGLLGTAK